MSTHARNDSIPEWTRGDRLRKARTIRKILLNAWVLRTGVSAESGRGR